MPDDGYNRRIVRCMMLGKFCLPVCLSVWSGRSLSTVPVRTQIRSNFFAFFNRTPFRPIGLIICVWYGNIDNQNYQSRCMANLESLKDRRIKLSQSFFKKILSTNSCLHTLLPSECNNEVLSKLRKPLNYPMPYSRTKRYQSFLNYALVHFQNYK